MSINYNVDQNNQFVTYIHIVVAMILINVHQHLFKWLFSLKYTHTHIEMCSSSGDVCLLYAIRTTQVTHIHTDDIIFMR